MFLHIVLALTSLIVHISSGQYNGGDIPGRPIDPAIKGALLFLKRLHVERFHVNPRDVNVEYEDGTKHVTRFGTTFFLHYLLTIDWHRRHIPYDSYDCQASVYLDRRTGKYKLLLVSNPKHPTNPDCKNLLQYNRT